jgi:hypothetical protein
LRGPLSDVQQDVSHGAGKTLIKKADDGPIDFRILIDIVQVRLEREFPNVLLLPQWRLFQMAATVAGCVALAIRLHFEVSEDQRTPLELRIRQTLARRFPESERMYEDCYRFVTDRLADERRSERGRYTFVVIAKWAYDVVSKGRKIEEEERIVGKLAETYQNETVDYWEETEAE